MKLKQDNESVLNSLNFIENYESFNNYFDLNDKGNDEIQNNVDNCLKKIVLLKP